MTRLVSIFSFDRRAFGPVFFSLALLFLITCLFLLGFSPSIEGATTVDRIVAQVNNEIITLSDLNAKIKSLPAEAKSQLPAGPTLENKVLELMIETELINQVARRMGIMVTEPEIDQAIEGIKQNNKITDAQLRDSLSKSGLTYLAFRNNIKGEIIKDRVLRENIIRKIVITDQEVEAFLRGDTPKNLPAGAAYQPGLMSGAPTGPGVSPRAKVRIIFLSSSPQQSAKVMEKARQIKNEIDAGLSFADAAKRYSQGPGADDGGNTNLTVSELQPQLQQVANTLTPGRCSQPLDGGQAVLLMYLEPTGEKASDDPKPKSKAKPGDFSQEDRLAARRQLEQLKLNQKYEDWINDLKNKANIKIMLN
ncbi:MAG: SurA N-terminal domain-containing protein [Deltaproteobacteria bacterium]|jgi:peptidyl-prolyl cis-trans isomerase SurA|nr:SurA N-terminal domain-containing protein [Deltaproteobacteria bacterium]